MVMLANVERRHISQRRGDNQGAAVICLKEESVRHAGKEETGDPEHLEGNEGDA